MKSAKKGEAFSFLLTVPLGNGRTVQEDRNGEMLTVHEVCLETGVTRKTLYFYDKIGLLKPSFRRGKQQEKMYSREAVKKLKIILAYQQAGLTLKEIEQLISQPQTEALTVFRTARNRLEEERNALELKITRLDRLICLAEAQTKEKEKMKNEAD
jgi:DNA-binding transcriptional MerR regulator